MRGDIKTKTRSLGLYQKNVLETYSQLRDDLKVALAVLCMLQKNVFYNNN